MPGPPLEVTDCNCSICHRYGVLWAYYPQSQVQVFADVGSTEAYAWGDRVIRFVRCAHCGCVMAWERLVPVDGAKMGINARNFDPDVLAAVPRVFLDGAAD